MEREYPDRPLVAVGVVVQRKGEVLIAKRGKQPSKGLWSIPGGAVELGETVEEAALREVREECGVDIRVEGVLQVVDAIRKGGDGRVRYHYTLVEVGAIYRGGELCAGSDALAARWVRPEDLEAFEMPDLTRRVIRWAVRGRGRAGLAHFPPAYLDDRKEKMDGTDGAETGHIYGRE